MSTTTTTFDLGRFARAVEERDTSTQLTMYRPDARVTIADKVTQPGSPRVLRSREQVEGWLRDVNGRDMTHAVQGRVADGAAQRSPMRAGIRTALTSSARPSSSSRTG